MASEYLKWKFRDVQPEEKVELTKEQKRKNWWDYHKWHVVIGIVLLFAAGNILYHVLGIGEVKPDYQFAYVGAAQLPDDTAAALEAALANLADDANGDGRVCVRLNQYADGSNSDTADAAYYNMASSVKLITDITSRESYFFLLEDPEAFQRNYAALRSLNGAPSDAGDSWEDCCIRWTDCPALSGLDLGTFAQTMLNQQLDGDSQELLSNLYIARRGFWTEATTANVEACDALWDKLTEGAQS